MTPYQKDAIAHLESILGGADLLVFRGLVESFAAPVANAAPLQEPKHCPTLDALTSGIQNGLSVYEMCRQNGWKVRTAYAKLYRAGLTVKTLREEGGRE